MARIAPRAGRPKRDPDDLAETEDGRQKSGENRSIALPRPPSVPGVRSAPGSFGAPIRVALALACALVGLGAAPWLGAASALPVAVLPSELRQDGATATPAPTDITTPADDPLLLPDLLTRPPAELTVARLGSRRILRFTNTVWNGGDGPLELNGVPDPATGSIQVAQRAYTTSGVAVDWPVGVFVFHPTHLHWHLDGFVIYQLWSVVEGGKLDRLIASSGKLSYCLIDTDLVDRYAPTLQPGSGYFGCGRSRQGLSIGWGDTYRAYLDGQSLPLDDAPDGLYALVSTANANRVLRESKVSNDTGLVYIELSANRVTVVPRSRVVRDRCPAEDTC